MTASRAPSKRFSDSTADFRQGNPQASRQRQRLPSPAQSRLVLLHRPMSPPSRPNTPTRPNDSQTNSAREGTTAPKPPKPAPTSWMPVGDSRLPERRPHHSLQNRPRAPRRRRPSQRPPRREKSRPKRSPAKQRTGTGSIPGFGPRTRV